MTRSTDKEPRLTPELSPRRLGALSTAVARHFKSCDDRETAQAVSVRFYDGYVVTVLQHGLTRGEPTLFEGEHAPLVDEPRCRLEEAIAAELVRAAEQALGRRVLAHRTQVIPASGIRFEIFELDGPRAGGRGLQLPRLERS